MIPLLLQAEVDPAGGGIGDIAIDTAEKFGIYWDLFIPQVISFCIVAFLLNKFAYKPIVDVLQARRAKIEEGLANAEKIKAELADAEAKREEILRDANAEAQKMINEAKVSAAALGEKKQQEALAQAEQIVAKAHEATILERDQVMSDVKSQIGRLVVDTTAKVTGKVLTPEDQHRLNEETAKEVAA